MAQATQSKLRKKIDRVVWALTFGLLALGGVGTAVLPGGDTDLAPGYFSLGGPAKPLTLIVPAIKVRATILPIEVTVDGELDPPPDVKDVGWWQRSAPPGAYDGQTVITGHTVHTGGGVFNDLGNLRKGQVVRIITKHGTLDYRTTKIFEITPAQLARQAVQLFSQDRQRGRLVLITCTEWNGSSYDKRIIAFGKPLGVKAESNAAG